MEVSDLTTYLVLSYLAHTVAKVSAGLLPAASARQRARLQEWLSTGFGVGLAFTTGVDLLSDVGVSVMWPPLGLIVTGILMGQGAKYGLNLVRGVQNAAGRTTGGEPPAAPGAGAG
jgi:hypothetical protein